jgi:hypothetical protein
MVATQAATQGALLSTPITEAAWHTKPSRFVIAANDRAISPEQEISTAKRMNAKTLTLPSSHVPMLSQPQKVADFIIEAAASAVSIMSETPHSLQSVRGFVCRPQSNLPVIRYATISWLRRVAAPAR